MSIVSRVIFLLMCGFFPIFAASQPIYDNCSTPLQLCTGETFSAHNIGATSTVCTGCEDDFNFCFISQNSVWFTFTTYTAGDIQVDVSNLTFETGNELQATLISTTTPCSASGYTQIGNCVSNATTDFSLNATGLSAETTYYVVINGGNGGNTLTPPSECSFDIAISGSSVSRPTPSISMFPTDTVLCLNQFVQFDAYVTNCPEHTNYRWFVNGNLVSTNTEPIFQTTNLQNGDTISVQTSCYSVCSEMVWMESNALVVTSFTVDAGPEKVINPGQSTILDGATTASEYSWSPSFYLSDPSALTPIASPTETTTFLLTATENGCSLSDQVTVTVSTPLDIPNTFSPNGDDLNDTWVIDGIDLYPNANMLIYDRWGQQIYQSTGYSNSDAWDGTSKSGTKLSEGVYFYVLELRDDERQVMNGSITLLR